MAHDLFEDHRKIITAAEDLLSFIRADADFRIDELGHRRARLGGIIMAHLRAEEQGLIGPLTAGGLLDAVPGAKTALGAVRDAHRGYSDHIRKWTPQAIERDRAGYVVDVRGIVDMLKAVIAREEADLYWPGLKLLAPALRVGNG